jgi:hypothetical protein
MPLAIDGPVERPCLEFVHLTWHGTVHAMAPQILPNLTAAEMHHLDVAIHAMNAYLYDYHHGLSSFSMKADLQEAGVFRLPHCLGFADKLKLGSLEVQRDRGLPSLMSRRCGSPSSKRVLMIMPLQLVRPMISSRLVRINPNVHNRLTWHRRPGGGMVDFDREGGELARIEQLCGRTRLEI